MPESLFLQNLINVIKASIVQYLEQRQRPPMLHRRAAGKLAQVQGVVWLSLHGKPPESHPQQGTPLFAHWDAPWPPARQLCRVGSLELQVQCTHQLHW